MPCFGISLFQHGETVIARSICSGGGCPADRDTSVPDHVAVTQRGRFSVRHRRGQVMFDPSCASVFRSSDDYQTHHPDGGDEGLSIISPTLLGRFDPWQPVRLGAAAQVRLHQLGARLAAGPLDVLEVEETLTSVFEVDQRRPRSSHRAQAAAREIAHEVATRFDEPLPLTKLAARVGLSPFAATRLFRGAMGVTIHQYQVELRLRHALSLLYETDRPLADIAVATGFANQGHFGNHFRRRFGLSPGRARSSEGVRALAAAVGAP